MTLECSIDASRIFSGGVGRDGIPALTDPPFVFQSDADAISYLGHQDRVIGLRIDGQAYAIPHNILWWHEIVNLNVGGQEIVVTYCPLTGSSLAFDRSAVGGAEFGVSGLLYQNNLIMYDRTASESLWPQMLAGARCGPKDGTTLPRVPLVEMTWQGWTQLYPGTLVVSGFLDFGREYGLYPYGDYEDLDNASFLFPMPVSDLRRRPKERVLGIASPSGGIAFPLGALGDLGPHAAVEIEHEGAKIVVLFDASRQAAMAFSRVLDGELLSFEATRTGVVDVATGTRWTVDGGGQVGPLRGRRLEPVVEAYVAFWGAWTAFHPRTALWTGR